MRSSSELDELFGREQVGWVVGHRLRVSISAAAPSGPGCWLIVVHGNSNDVVGLGMSQDRDGGSSNIEDGMVGMWTLMAATAKAWSAATMSG